MSQTGRREQKTMWGGASRNTVPVYVRRYWHIAGMQLHGVPLSEGFSLMKGFPRFVRLSLLKDVFIVEGFSSLKV